MRFLLILTQVESAWEQAPEGEPERVFKAYTELEKELRAQGKLLESYRLQSRTEARTLRNVPDDQRPVEDGPFVDIEESIGGLSLLECESRDEAIEWAKRMPNYGHGSIEVRPLWDE